MYNAKIDVKNQKFVIEDRDGNVIAFRPMPWQQVPNPGREVLMAQGANQNAWNRIYDLVQDAND